MAEMWKRVLYAVGFVQFKIDLYNFKMFYIIRIKLQNICSIRQKENKVTKSYHFL